jgi:hypothetical protein
MIGLPILSILLQENMWTDPENIINRSQTHECGNWGWDRAIPFLGIHKWDFCCSVPRKCAEYRCVREPAAVPTISCPVLRTVILERGIGGGGEEYITIRRGGGGNQPVTTPPTAVGQCSLFCTLPAINEACCLILTI